MVKITIDGITVDVAENTTILHAAKKAGIEIPTLCYLEGINEIGACRVCMVEIAGQDKLAAACNTVAKDGMVVYTNSPKARRARKTNVELILSEHDCRCATCVRSGNCSLQKLANDLRIDNNPFSGKIPGSKKSSFPLIRDNAKCIKCMRCIQVCDKIQGLGIWDVINRGSRTSVDVADGRNMDINCSLCGQCITHCPVGALKERNDTDKVYAALADKDIITVAQIAPAVRTAWAEELGLSREEATEGKMTAAVKALGFDYVFDTNFAADLTIMEEGSELVERLKSGENLPMFTSCCPGWVRFVKSEFPDFAAKLSTAKSPQQMFGAVTKSYFAEKIGVDPRKIFCVSIMPCTAKKYEASVGCLNDGCGAADVDVSLTTRELAGMLRADHINMKALTEAEFDSPLGESTGAGVIFGASGGVMEAALRSAYWLITGEEAGADSFKVVRGAEGIKEATFEISGKMLSVAAVSGLANARKLITDVISGAKHYDFVEIMACPGGCAGGGGQPIHDGCELASERGEMLYKLDANKPIRYSHKNPEIIKLYQDYLGHPCSGEAHRLLHTDCTKW